MILQLYKTIFISNASKQGGKSQFNCSNNYSVFNACPVDTLPTAILRLQTVHSGANVINKF